MARGPLALQGCLLRKGPDASRARPRPFSNPRRRAEVTRGTDGMSRARRGPLRAGARAAAVPFLARGDDRGRPRAC